MRPIFVNKKKNYFSGFGIFKWSSCFNFFSVNENVVRKRYQSFKSNDSQSKLYDNKNGKYLMKTCKIFKI